MVIKKFQDLTIDELYQILSLRNEVFVVEQNCVYQDIDYIDQNSFHLFFLENKKIVAYARLVAPNIVYENSLAIGRVLVKEGYRNKGYAKDLMKYTIEQANNLYTNMPITISAQFYLLKFYSSLGFKQVSEEYLEDGIPHVRMTLTK